MPMFTYRSREQGELHNAELIDVLSELNRLEKERWVVDEIEFEVRNWWKRKKCHRYQLLKHVGGSEFQVINFWMPTESTINSFVPAEVVIAYIYGALGERR